ncbi:DUF421 domain-containing protein [Cellulomonas fimi]|uniref:DUF421 domain-containing protein n=1 Tax=Cellulomonas fimi TaxID=1708 RepID=A0A7Y0LXF7_CELFI|nr:DUF421 domain-containing protein [Cellulomonas fimi]
MFSTSIPVLEIVLRGTVTFLALLALMRIVGQRESGGLGLTDVLVVVLVADAASSGMTGDVDSITEGLLLACTILFWSVVVDAAAYRWPRLAAIVKARPRPLIEDGRLNRHAMRREFMSHDEVLSQLRLHGIEDLAEVRRAYLEPNGMISIIRSDGVDPDGAPTQPPH